MLPFYDDYSQSKNLRYQLIPSKDTDDQRTLESDWPRNTTSNTQLKEVVSDTDFLW